MEKGREYISTLVKNKFGSRIRVRLSRIWNVGTDAKDEKDLGLDAVAIDEKGDVIHIVMERKYAQIHRKNLKEGQIYTITDFGCVQSLNYRPVSSNIRIRVNGATKFLLESENVVSFLFRKDFREDRFHLSKVYKNGKA
ncbi:hypothetical protein SLA2020_341220 [Shorea laevis]